MPARVAIPGTIIPFTPYEVKYNDIHPGEPELIDIVAKYDDEKVCYVWCYDSYRCRRLKNPELMIANKELFVHIDVRFAGQHLEALFKVLNGGSREKFELSNSVSRQQKKHIQEIHRRPSLDAQR